MILYGGTELGGRRLYNLNEDDCPTLGGQLVAEEGHNECRDWSGLPWEDKKDGIKCEQVDGNEKRCIFPPY